MGAFLGSPTSYYKTAGLGPRDPDNGKANPEDQGCCSDRGGIRTSSITISLLSHGLLEGDTETTL